MVTAILLFQSILFSFPIEEIESKNNSFQLSKLSQNEIILTEFETGQVSKINIAQKKYSVFSNQNQDFQSIAAIYCNIDLSSYIYYDFSNEIIKLNSDFEEIYSIPFTETIGTISSLIVNQNRLLIYDNTEYTIFIYDLRLNKMLQRISSENYENLNFDAPSRFLKSDKHILLLDQKKIHYFDHWGQYIFTEHINLKSERNKLTAIKQFSQINGIRWILDKNHNLYKNTKLFSDNIIDFITFKDSLIFLNTNFDLIRIDL